MKSKNKKIFLLFAGGTALDEKDINGTSVQKEANMAGWLEQVPEATLMAKIEPIFVSKGRSELSGIKLWQRIGQIIFEKAEEADGFVIVTDVESVLNLGIALCFSLKNFNKAVILTSSQITKEAVKLSDWPVKKAKAYGGLGVKANLINAVQIVNMSLPAVSLMFGNRIINPVKAKRIQTIGLNLFESADNKYLGKIDFGISITEKIQPGQGPIKLRNNFEEDIQFINFFSGTNFKKEINLNAKGIVIKDLPSLAELKDADIKKSALVHSPFLTAANSPSEKIFMAHQMTWETAVIKYMWALAQGANPVELMENEYCGEFVFH